MLLCGSSSFVTPRTVACQAPLFMGFPGQEYWSGWPFPSPGDLPNVGTEHASPESAGRVFSTEAPGKPSSETYTLLICVKGLFGIWGLGVEGGLDVEHQLCYYHVWPGHLPHGETSCAPLMGLM